MQIIGNTYVGGNPAQQQLSQSGENAANRIASSFALKRQQQATANENIRAEEERRAKAAFESLDAELKALLSSEQGSNVFEEGPDNPYYQDAQRLLLGAGAAYARAYGGDPGAYISAFTKRPLSTAQHIAADRLSGNLKGNNQPTGGGTSAGDNDELYKGYSGQKVSYQGSGVAVPAGDFTSVADTRSAPPVTGGGFASGLPQDRSERKISPAYLHDLYNPTIPGLSLNPVDKLDPNLLIAEAQAKRRAAQGEAAPVQPWVPNPQIDQDLADEAAMAESRTDKAQKAVEFAQQVERNIQLENVIAKKFNTSVEELHKGVKKIESDSVAMRYVEDMIKSNPEGAKAAYEQAEASLNDPAQSALPVQLQFVVQYRKLMRDKATKELSTQSASDRVKSAQNRPLAREAPREIPSASTPFYLNGGLSGGPSSNTYEAAPQATPAPASIPGGVISGPSSNVYTAPPAKTFNPQGLSGTIPLTPAATPSSEGVGNPAVREQLQAAKTSEAQSYIKNNASRLKEAFNYFTPRLESGEAEKILQMVKDAPKAVYDLNPDIVEWAIRQIGPATVFNKDSKQEFAKKTAEVKRIKDAIDLPNNARGTGRPQMSPAELARHEARTGDYHYPALIGVKEGVVNARAMENGGDEVVRMLNEGIPALADGYNGAQGELMTGPSADEQVAAIAAHDPRAIAMAQYAAAQQSGQTTIPVGNTGQGVTQTGSPGYDMSGEVTRQERSGYEEGRNDYDPRYDTPIGRQATPAKEYSSPPPGDKASLVDMISAMVQDKAKEGAKGAKSAIKAAGRAVNTYAPKIAALVGQKAEAIALGNMPKAQAVTTRLLEEERKAITAHLSDPAYRNHNEKVREALRQFMETADDTQLAYYGFDNVLKAKQDAAKFKEEVAVNKATSNYHNELAANQKKSIGLVEAQIRLLNSQINKTEAEESLALARAKAIDENPSIFNMSESAEEIRKWAGVYKTPDELNTFIMTNPTVKKAFDNYSVAITGNPAATWTNSAKLSWWDKVVARFTKEPVQSFTGQQGSGLTTAGQTFEDTFLK